MTPLRSIACNRSDFVRSLDGDTATVIPAKVGIHGRTGVYLTMTEKLPPRLTSLGNLSRVIINWTAVDTWWFNI